MTVLITIPVTVIVRAMSGVDEFGNDTWTPTASTVDGVYASGGSVERLEGGDQVITQPTVYLPAGVDVSAIDAVQVAGLTFEVDGDPHNWSLQPNPYSGWTPQLPIVVPLRRVTG